MIAPFYFLHPLFRWNWAGIYNSTQHHPKSVYFANKFGLKLRARLAQPKSLLWCHYNIIFHNRSVQRVVIWRQYLL